VVLVLTAALVAPYFIDWTSYRAAFEREAGRVLGREVRVEGMARARLLPFPSVTFTDVVVAGTEPGEPAMTVDEFSMDAELAPFLRGELLIFDMRLVRPRMNIEIGPNGRVDWAVRPSSPFDPRQVMLEKVTISGGTILLHQQASARTITLGRIDSEVSARTLAGPWRIAGSLEIDGMPVKLTASTGAVDEQGAMRVRISATPRDYPILIETDGSARIEEEKGVYSGTFRVARAEPERSVEQASAQPPEAGARNAGNRISGRFSLDHERLAVEEFRFETGPPEDPYTAEGNAVVELGADPSFAISADGAQIRLEGPEAESSVISGLSADARLAALTAFITNLPKPTIPGTIAVNLPAIVAGDTTIRQISVRAQPVDGGWNIGSFGATLPGRTRFEGEGVLATEDPLSFKGKMILAVGQPSGFAAWLAKDVDDAIRNLPSAGFSADVELTRERQRFDNLELILGDASFRGEIDRQSRPDVRPALVLRLEGSTLDVEGAQAFASLFIDDAGRNRLAGHDVDLEVAAGPVSAEGLTAERLDTALRLREGTLEIDRLAITGLADANISATGTINGIGGEPSGKVDASVVAVDLAPLIGVLAQRFPDARLLSALDRNAAAFPGLFADATIDIVADAANDGGAGNFDFRATGTAGGTALNLSASGNGSLDDLAGAEIATSLTARNDEAGGLYALFGLPALPLGFSGSAETEFSARGIPRNGLQTTLRFTGEGLAANFDGTLLQEAEGFSAQGEARIESEDLEPWLATAGLSLPGFGFGLPVRLSASIDHARGLTVIDGISGTVADTPVSGDLNAELREGLPHFTGSLALGGLDLRLAAEMVVGSAALDTGGGTWPQSAFQQTSGTPFSADVELATDQLWLGNAATVEEAQLRLKLDRSGFAVSDLSGRLLDGAIEGLAEFRNDGGTGLLSAQLSLRDAPLPSLLPEGGLSGTTDVSASLTASGKSVEAMVAALSGSGSAALKEFSVSGINPAALDPIIAEADTLGVEIDAGKVAEFAPPLLRDGSFPAGDAELAFTIANGVARTPPVQFQSRGAQMSAEAAVDLRDRMVSASGSVRYDPGLEAVAGSEPSVRFNVSGPLGEAQATLDIQPLAQFLTQRALEREQARVEHMQALLLERQRLRREVSHFRELQARRAAEETERVRLAREAERARRAEEERRRHEAEEARRRAEEEARRREEETLRSLETIPPPAAQPANGTVPGQSADEPPETGDTVIERQPLAPPAVEENNVGPLDRSGLGSEPVLEPEEFTVERFLERLNQ